MTWFVRVPASSANLGPGFDVLAMALSIDADIGIDGVDEGLSGHAPPEGGHWVDEYHPATVAFHRGGGVGRLWLRSSIPMGRGLGFSGAVRSAGVAAAFAQRAEGRIDPADLAQMLAIVAGLEGHPDNVAASLYGGIVATAAGRTVRIATQLQPSVVVWVPSFETATDHSRSKLADVVPFEDAAFNVGRAALLVAAIAAGDVGALRIATEDRLHQARRLAAAQPSAAALQAALDAGAWCAWLSGSGPTVAAWCAPQDATTLAAALPPDGHTKVLSISVLGARVVSGSGGKPGDLTDG